MPWIIDSKISSKKYELSLYAKEELPTWSEVFNDWFEGKHFIYDPSIESHQELDKFWEIPRKKYLLAIVCNQFNKTLFEDGMKERLLKHINDKKMFPNATAVDIRFVIEGLYPPDKFSDAINEMTAERVNQLFINDGSVKPPPIYTIPLPNGAKNVFIVNDYPRVNVNDLYGRLSLMAITLLKMDTTDEGDTDAYAIHEANLLNSVKYNREKQQSINSEWVSIMTFMLNRYMEYFSDPVGWKDENGNLISGESEHRKYTRISDPAL